MSILAISWIISIKSLTFYVKTYEWFSYPTTIVLGIASFSHTCISPMYTSYLTIDFSSLPLSAAYSTPNISLTPSVKLLPKEVCVWTSTLQAEGHQSRIVNIKVQHIGEESSFIQERKWLLCCPPICIIDRKLISAIK